jgi:hypothetical protein
MNKQSALLKDPASPSKGRRKQKELKFLLGFWNLKLFLLKVFT